MTAAGSDRIVCFGEVWPLFTGMAADGGRAARGFVSDMCCTGIKKGVIIDMHPGIRIQKLLVKKGITQRRMAEDLHMNPNTVNGYIRQRRLPDCTTLLQIADYLDTSVDYLLGNTSVSSYPELSVSEEEGSLLSNYRALDEEGRRLLLKIAALLHTCSNGFLLPEE